jgi:hypothetical protein
MSVFFTRWAGFTVAMAVAAGALGLVGCSGGDEDSSLQRSPTPAGSRVPASSKGTKSSGDTAPAATPQSAPDPTPPAPDAGAAPAPAPAPAPPAPGSCGAPKCFGFAGVGGCKATDAAGDLVAMGCQDGACACVVGGQTTTTFDGDVNSGDDARSLFLVNCTCN